MRRCCEALFVPGDFLDTSPSGWYQSRETVGDGAELLLADGEHRGGSAHGATMRLGPHRGVEIQQAEVQLGICWDAGVTVLVVLQRGDVGLLRADAVTGDAAS